MASRTDPEAARKEMLAAGYEPLEPFTNTKTQWRCRCLVPTCGLESTPTLENVRSRGSRCKYCAEKAFHPEVALAIVTAAGWTPNEDFHGSTKPWRCTCNVCGESTGVYIRNVRNGTRCGVCAQRRTVPERAAARVRELGYEPVEPYPGNNKTPWHLIHVACGRHVYPAYNGVASGTQGGCLPCGRERTRAALMTDADLAAEQVRALAAEPQGIYPGADRPWTVRCLLCENETVIKFRWATKRGGIACNDCAGRVPDLENLTRLMTTSGAMPIVPYPGVDKGWKSVCMECGEQIAPRISALRSGQGACKYCARRAINTELAKQIMIDRQLEPLKPYPGNDVPWPSRCRLCSREVSPTFRTVREHSTGCQYCDDRVINPEDAAKLMRDRGRIPIGPYPGAHEPWPSTCEACGRTSAPTYESVRNGRGCRYCADYGFDFGQPSCIYLLWHPQWQAFKIGICGQDGARIRQHVRSGWVIAVDDSFREGIWDTADGDIAWNVEQMMLRHWREDLSPDPGVAQSAMPQGGYSETITGDFMELETEMNLIEMRVAEASRKSGQLRR